MPDNKSHQKPNKLIRESSPYLLQHAYNPVDWHAWNNETLQKAKNENMPLLVSIGYSTCHWCHVMERESFEDEEVASLMNENFICIKVDREERPDVDQLFMDAVQMITGAGGWPLNCFALPDGRPFYGGTYFRKEQWTDILTRVADLNATNSSALEDYARQLIEGISESNQRHLSNNHAIRKEDIEMFRDKLHASADFENGGLKGAPKFPLPPALEAELNMAVLYSDEHLKEHLETTLEKMASGGIYDQAGGGFARYSVDSFWKVPHFEKMLYDNAQLLPLYAEAAVRFDNPSWAQTAALTAEFLARDLRLPEGGLASSLDADSLPPADDEADDEPADSAVEGAYYLWTPSRFQGCLGADRLDLAKARFGLDGPPNFDGDKWHLVCARNINELTRSAADAERTHSELATVRAELLACRQARPAPARDDKMLAGTNALASAGLMRAGRLLGNKGWLGLGVETASLTWQRLFAESPERAVWRDGRCDHPALLDDYAAMLMACMECLQCRWDPDWLERAEQLAAIVLDRFFDNETDTLYLTPVDHERLIMRPTANTDDATPAGAALAARGLARLGHLIASGEWLDLAGRIVDAARGDIQRTPAAHAGMLIAARELERPQPQVLIGGKSGEGDDWHAQLARRPDVCAYRVRADGDVLPKLLAEVAEAASTRAVVCLGTQCLEPADSFEQLEARLAEAGAGAESAGLA